MAKRIALYIVAFFSFYALSLVGFYLYFNDNLPDIAAWIFQPKRITKVYSEDGQHLKDFLEENREILTYEEIPQSTYLWLHTEGVSKQSIPTCLEKMRLQETQKTIHSQTDFGLKSY